MIRILQIVLIYCICSVTAITQEKPAPVTPKIQDARSQMVLRGTTRDQVYTVKDNFHKKRVQQRKQVAINRQQMLMKKKVQQLQTNKVRMQQRKVQQRKVRQQAVRRQQNRGRK